MSELNKIALKIISSGKGILAADESTATMTKRLESVKVESTDENRLKFRSILLSSKSMKDCIGGVILYDETEFSAELLGRDPKADIAVLKINSEKNEMFIYQNVSFSI